MNRKEFGELVAALRKEHSDFVGNDLRQWSARTLAERASLPIGTVEAIEQGVLRKIDSEILIKLADALELTTMERKEFFLASIGLEADAYAPKIDPFDLHCFLQTVWHIPLPAFISDNYGDFVAANHCIIRFLDIPQDFIVRSFNARGSDPAALNFMRVICSPASGYRTTLGDGWDANIVRNMLFFRRITFRYRSTDRFRNLWKALMKDRTFKTYWKDVQYREDANDSDLELYSYRHARLKQRVKYIAAVNQLITNDGERYMTTYIPANEAIAKIFEQTAREAGVGWMAFENES
jgi:hypothetical protein